MQETIYHMRTDMRQGLKAQENTEWYHWAIGLRMKSSNWLSSPYFFPGNLIRYLEKG